MSEESFVEYMGEQIERIREFKAELKEERGESLTLEEAARAWVKKYADAFREDFAAKSSESDSGSSDRQ